MQSTCRLALQRQEANFASRGASAVPQARLPAGISAALHPHGCQCPLHRRSAAPTLPRRADRKALRTRAFYTPNQGGAPPVPIPPGLSGDELKEASRREMRSVFDFDRWRAHRSSGRYLRHVLGLADSKIMQGLAAPLAYVMSVATTVAVYNVAAEAGYVPIWPELKLATNAPFGLTSFALSLLLVFRTNSSYGRWDEARKMWGLIVNRSRDLVRQGLGYIPATQPELQAMLCRWTVAYSRSLMCHLRPGENLEAELKNVLYPNELAALLASAHRPNYCVQVMTAILKEAQLPGAVYTARDSTACIPAGAAYRMDENVTVFADTTGGCERILRTPIPLSYTRHTSRFMMIWLTLLPFTLWDSCRWAMIPISFIISFLLLGIEEIGVAVEEPFTILPLETICNTIETNIRELYRIELEQGNNPVTAELLVSAILPPGSNGSGYSNGNGAKPLVDDIKKKLSVGA